MTTVLVGIDGTGSRVVPSARRNQSYDREFSQSWVRRICNLHEGQGPTLYRRGPVMLGGGLVDAISAGFEFAKNAVVRTPTSKVLLTGYSRGAAGAVAVAARLKQINVSVEAIVLFDCVDRHIAIDAETIPRNVKHVRHVVRNPASSSRESFDNDGMRHFPETDYPAAYQFMCTHGGMGGMPWAPEEGESPSDLIDEGGIDGMTRISYAQDARVSLQVWDFCFPFLQQYKFVK